MYILYNKELASQHHNDKIYEDWARDCKVDLTKPLEVVEDHGHKWTCKTPIGSTIRGSVVHVGKNSFSPCVIDKPLEEYM
jgi:hypothetical protein